MMPLRVRGHHEKSQLAVEISPFFFKPEAVNLAYRRDNLKTLNRVDSVQQENSRRLKRQ